MTSESCRSFRRRVPGDEKRGLWGNSPCRNCKRGRDFEREAAAKIPVERCKFCGDGFPERYEGNGNIYKLPQVYFKYGACQECFLSQVMPRLRRRSQNHKRGAEFTLRKIA